MSEFKITLSAMKLMEVFKEISVPLSPQKCFNGLFSFRGLKTPNLSKGLSKLNQYFLEVINFSKDEKNLRGDALEMKDCLKEFYGGNAAQNSYGNPMQESIIISTIDHKFDSLLSNCTVWLATEKDDGNKVVVNNIFLNKPQTIKIIKPLGYSVKDNPRPLRNKKEFDVLAYYTPETGSVVMFIDRIFLWYQDENPELIFQKVLLHEFIHALLDIAPRTLVKFSNTNWLSCRVQKKNVDKDKEETYVNSLVLYVYKSLSPNSDILTAVETFIAAQPDAYKKGLEESSKGKKVLKCNLIEFLKTKLTSNQNEWKEDNKIFFSVNYTSDGANQKNEFPSLFEELQSSFMTSEINGLLPDVFAQIYKDMSGGNSLHNFVCDDPICFMPFNYFNKSIEGLLIKGEMGDELAFIRLSVQKKNKEILSLRQSLYISDNLFGEIILKKEGETKLFHSKINHNDVSQNDVHSFLKSILDIYKFIPV